MEATKAEKLERITQQIAACTICCRSGVGHCVPGEGDVNAPVVFVGEAPGKTESRLGHPFVGRAGRMLRRSIRAIGLDESRVFLTNVFPYLPKSGTPGTAAIQHSVMHLQAQLDVIHPDIVILLGNTAVRAVLDPHISAVKAHGKLFRKPGTSTLFYVTVHPAAAMRFPVAGELFKRDFHTLCLFMNERADLKCEVLCSDQRPLRLPGRRSRRVNG